ncbi:MAG: hypothetical protein JHD16_06755 [Solirubrobacteraceae bacterium]|nr:hypothetical protein [Solirubrobacteraceae bacterium]
MARRSTLLLPLFLACLLPALAPSTASAARAPWGMFGVGDWSWPTAATLDRESSRGLRRWRVVLDFTLIGRTAGVHDWAGTDGLMRELNRRGVVPLFVLKGCPARHCPTGKIPMSGQALADWKTFVGAAARRYGTGGVFWAANPTLTPRPLVYWQVMNEVNGAQEWPSPSAANYGAFVVSTSAALKAADRSAKVVLAGLPAIMTIWLKDYLPALYAQPGFKEAVDVIAVHGYAPSPAETAAVLDTARAIMLRHDDGATPLWVTEFAWATGGLVGDPFVVSESTQAAYLRAAGDLMVGCAARWNLKRAYWFGWRDARAPGTGYWGHNVGLTRFDGSSKPALAALDEFTRGVVLPGGRADTCPLPGGTQLDVVVPDTRVVAGPGARTADARPAYRFEATESPVRFECSMDGTPWTTCNPVLNGAWRPSSDLDDGVHVLRVRAVDPQGNVDATPATHTTIYDRYPPDTYLSGTWGNVETGSVALTLSSNEPVLQYECSVDAAPWRTCSSPFTATLTSGSHTVGVRAVDLAGNVDPDPAVAWFQVSPSVN